MFTRHLFATSLALLIAGSTGFAQTGSKPAKPMTSPPGKKLTYEEAWKRCTAYARQHADETQRYLRAASCMKRYGHNI